MESERIIDWLLALSIGGVLVEIARSFIQRKKMNADYADVIAGSAIRLLEPLEKRIAELEQELRATKRELVETKSELIEARGEIRTLSAELLDHNRGGRNPHE
jgi:septal ring factor EnvC (AmiA/AmiB activator)